MSLFSNEVFHQFTSPWNGNVKIYRQLEIFAKSLGWYPSDIIEEKKKDSMATGHLFVEHGLENAAVISFLDNRFSYDQLSQLQQNNLLKVSYNNLVDLHISVDSFKIHGLHNRIENRIPIYSGKVTETFENLRSDFYTRIIDDKKYKANLLALDDSLINTISYWKRIISSELSNNNINEELSNFFNTLIFCRAIEDDKNKSLEKPGQKGLIAALYSSKGNISVASIIQKVLKNYDIDKWPQNLIDKEKLSIFDALDSNTLFNFFNDLYLVKNTPYEYDFSIISKHALSRIYERYVSILKVENTTQLSFFPQIPTEHRNKLSGSYYTPQFIARFFTRYIEQKKPNFQFEDLKIVEPSVGSGIFLRTLLERKSEGLENYKPEYVSQSFENVLGVDINPTACHAAKLSLSLLHLVTTGSLPKSNLKIIAQDSLDYFQSDKHKNTTDICISNPPFVAYNTLPEVTREKIKKILGDTAYGRSDLYLPFVKIAIDILKPSGLGLFVLPNTFLISDSAKNLRRYLAENTFIKCVVDLSDIQVFDDTGIYPILLIFEKTNKDVLREKEIYGSKPLSIIAKIQDNVGKALFDVLNESKVETISHSIYEVNQDFFKSESWFLLPPSEYTLKSKLNNLSKLHDYTEVRTGFSLGAGDVFLIEKQAIPKGESAMYVPYLSDREMSTYIVPKNTEKYLFYPFIGNKIIAEEKLKKEYHQTYTRLLSKKKILEERNEVKEGKLSWWQPQRPRKPNFMMVPKILTPHLVFTPKFCIDFQGKFSVARGPFITLNENNQNPDMLYYLSAILNSSVCFWYLLTHAPKYQHGYAMLEKKYLNELPVPNPEKVDRNKIYQIIKLVKERIASSTEDAIFIEKKIDTLVTELYGLSSDEIKFLNLNI